jgi:hypothetical protein
MEEEEEEEKKHPYWVSGYSHYSHGRARNQNLSDGQMTPMAMPSKSLHFDPLGEEAERRLISVSVFSAIPCYLLMHHCLMIDCPHVQMIAPHDRDLVRADG